LEADVHLVPDWKEGWRWISTWGLMVLAALPQVWATLPLEVKAMAPAGVETWIFTAIAIGALVGRFVDQ
jgi:hypothetical protein